MESVKTPLSSELKLAIRWGGYALLAAALVYCFLTLRDLGTDAVVDRVSGTGWLVTIAVGLAYGAALTLLAIGWCIVAARKGALTLTDMIAIYGPAVVAKYIPGSIFQYGSRQVSGAEFGVGQKPMAKSSIAEIAMHVPAALICGAVLYVGGGLIAIGSLAAAGLAVAILARSPLVRAIGFQIAFFASFAALSVTLATLALPSTDANMLTAMFMFAWVAGFLVPVAPGGIGVRESVLIVLAVPGESAAVVASFALLTRFATTVGDAAMGLTGYWLLLSRRWNKQASA